MKKQLYCIIYLASFSLFGRDVSSIKTLNRINEFSLKNKIRYSISLINFNTDSQTNYNENEYFKASSLLKLPLVMNIFKIIERNKDLLNKKIMIDNSKVPKSVPINFNDEDSLVNFKEYTLKFLIYDSIVNSNNYSTFFLANNFDKEFIGDTLSTYISNYYVKNGQVYLKASEYIKILKALYQEKIISKWSQEYIIDLLSISDFNLGLKVVSSTVTKVANKFGVAAKDKNGNYQLHDCGLILQNNYNKAVCIMTEGKEMRKLISFIQLVSKQLLI